MRHRAAAEIRRIYGPVIGPVYLKQLIRAGRPQAGEILRAKAAIVAVRQGELLSTENREPPLIGAREARAFRESVARHFRKAGGTIVGIDGDLVLAAFGSPPERIAMRRLKPEMPYEDDAEARGSHSPAVKAVEFILDFLAGTPEAASWRFGIDTGDCAFAYSDLSGYSAFGRPVVRARILSNIAPRYKARILVTARVSEKIDGLLTRKLDAITDMNTKEKELFYEILIQPSSHPRALGV
jgi:class 3 adenylate cyclase